MLTIQSTGGLTRDEVRASLLEQARHLVEGEHDLIANMANLASLLYHSLTDVNWAGFYRMIDGELVLGPFSGLPACIRIALGRGVCGTAAAERRTIIVPDVDQFPGHIACDSASRSEIVVPVTARNELIGVLDIDSPILDRFDANDALTFERIADILVRSSHI